jgi:hypothetical protein
MFHDDDDILNNIFVIENYLNIINNIPANIIVSEIKGSHIWFWDKEHMFLKADDNIPGRLFNF